MLISLYDDRLKTFCNDEARFRFLLAHRHIVLRNLRGCKYMQFPNWPVFADAFALDKDKPLQKSGGDYPWSPLIWSVMQNNLEVTKHLIAAKANVNEQITVSG